MNYKERMARKAEALESRVYGLLLNIIISMGVSALTAYVVFDMLVTFHKK